MQDMDDRVGQCDARRKEGPRRRNKRPSGDRQRVDAACPLTDWLPPELVSHLFDVMGPRGTVQLGRTCRLLRALSEAHLERTAERVRRTHCGTVETATRATINAIVQDDALALEHVLLARITSTTDPYPDLSTKTDRIATHTAYVYAPPFAHHDGASRLLEGLCPTGAGWTAINMAVAIGAPRCIDLLWRTGERPRKSIEALLNYAVTRMGTSLWLTATRDSHLNPTGGRQQAIHDDAMPRSLVTKWRMGAPRAPPVFVDDPNRCTREDIKVAKHVDHIQPDHLWYETRYDLAGVCRGLLGPPPGRRSSHRKMRKYDMNPLSWLRFVLVRYVTNLIESGRAHADAAADDSSAWRAIVVAASLDCKDETGEPPSTQWDANKRAYIADTLRICRIVDAATRWRDVLGVLLAGGYGPLDPAMVTPSLFRNYNLVVYSFGWYKRSRAGATRSEFMLATRQRDKTAQKASVRPMSRGVLAQAVKHALLTDLVRLYREHMADAGHIDTDTTHPAQEKTACV